MESWMECRMNTMDCTFAGSWHLLHESTADAISTFHTLRRLSEAKSDPLHPDPKLQTLKPRTNP